MSNKPYRPRKKTLSFHEKQIRFFSISLVALVTVTFSVVLWLINHNGLKAH